MLSHKNSVAVLVLLLLSAKLHAQFVNYGTDPSNYKWKSVRTEHFNIIYPQNNDSIAYRYASLLEATYPHVKQSIGGTKEWRFPVVLHPGNMLSNGMVSWAPRRMEIITTPSSDLYAQRWDRQLALHETRHIFQTNKLIRGVFRPLYYGIGEQATGIASFLLPTWFLEGDAVVTETALSNSGRGRLPEFSMIYRTQMLSGDFYSFDKWYMGSYKDYAGSKYAFGYNLTAYARYQYGANVWDKVTSRYADRIFNLPPFSNALKHHTGVRPKELYKQTFSFLNEEWEVKEKEYQQSGFSPTYLSPAKKEHTSYKHPIQWNDSTIIAVKSNLSNLNALVSITNNKESHIKYIGSINSPITTSNKRIYWSEYVSGTRWAHQNYSVIKYLDFNAKNLQVKTLTPRQRLLSPAVNPSGNTLAASRVTITGENQIVLLNATTGEELTFFSTPDNEFAKELTFANDDTVFTTTIGTNGITIRKLTTGTGEWRTILEPTFSNITSLVWNNGKLYFESGLDGTNNIYCLDPTTRQTEKLTTARFGAFTPTLSEDNKRMIFADYYSKGYRIASVPMDSIQPQKANFNQPYQHKLAEVVSKQENFNLDTLDITPIKFEPKRYRKASHLFKAHSWAPFYYDISDVINMNADDFSTIVKPGAMVLSQNALNTSVAQAGWFYTDGDHHGKLAFTYMGWWPVIDLSVDYGGKAFTASWMQEEDTETENTREYIKGEYANRNLVEAEAQIYIPFNLTKNHYARGFQPSVSYFYTNNEYQQYESGKYRDFQYMLSELRFYNYRKMAKRDILPKWGYQVRLQHLFSPMNSENYGHLYAARLTTYFPGLFPNNGLMLRFGYQQQDVDNKALYLPKRIINQPRGYNYLYSTRKLLTFSADYASTLVSPDISIGSLMYVQRVRTNLFYELYRNQARKHASWNNQSSYGADVILDCNILQIDFPVSLGARIINPINYGNLQVEALFSVSF